MKHRKYRTQHKIKDRQLPPDGNTQEVPEDVQKSTVPDNFSDTFWDTLDFNARKKNSDDQEGGRALGFVRWLYYTGSLALAAAFASAQNPHVSRGLIVFFGVLTICGTIVTVIFNPQKSVLAIFAALVIIFGTLTIFFCLLARVSLGGW